MVVATLVLGTLFVANQFSEWITLSHNPATDPTHTAFGSLFFIMSGLHGLHVTLGLVAMIFLLGRLKGPKGDPGETAGLPGGQLLLALRGRGLGRPLRLSVPAQVDATRTHQAAQGPVPGSRRPWSAQWPSSAC